MQLSSNTNEGLRLKVLSQPTPAGQFRQAIIHAKGRQDAINEALLKLEEFELGVEERRIEKEILARQAQKTEDDLERDRLNLEIKRLTWLDKREDMERNVIDERMEDAMRERDFCRSMAADICDRAGVDFGSLPHDEFQAFMVEDTQIKLIRHFASYTLSHAIGFPPEVMQELLGMPEVERETFLAAQNGLSKQLLGVGDDE
jgi:hypothetical protein